MKMRDKKWEATHEVVVALDDIYRRVPTMLSRGGQGLYTEADWEEGRAPSYAWNGSEWFGQGDKKKESVIRVDELTVGTPRSERLQGVGLRRLRKWKPTHEAVIETPKGDCKYVPVMWEEDYGGDPAVYTESAWEGGRLPTYIHQNGHWRRASDEMFEDEKCVAVLPGVTMQPRSERMSQPCTIREHRVLSYVEEIVAKVYDLVEATPKGQREAVGKAAVSIIERHIDFALALESTEAKDAK